MVTINDVAAHAGVGAGTVSRVLNSSPRVSPETRARVLAAIDVLDYRPSPLARGLSRGRAHTFGVIVPFFPAASAVERMHGVIRALQGSHYDLVLFNVESVEERDGHFQTLLRRDRADGLLVLSLPPPVPQLDRLQRAGVPVVLVDARADGVPSVVTDDRHGGTIATEHLLELGHTRIAFLGDEPVNPFGFESSARREDGYRAALVGAGLQPDARHVGHGAHDKRIGRALAERLLATKPRPTAIFAASAVLALGVLDAARAAGLSVPGDLSVVGFDDVEVASHIGLTTVRQPLFESGDLGARLLLEALGGEGAPAAVEHELPLELVLRTTTAPPPARRGRRP